MQCGYHVIQCRYAAMQKDFDRRNIVKKVTDAAPEEARLFYREGEIWWVRLGKNVGYELDGKAQEFTRPVIVIKKYNQYSFLALPLTTSAKPNPYRLPIGEVAGKLAFAVLSQLRNIDSKRLVVKITHVEQDALETIKKEASRVNFG